MDRSSKSKRPRRREGWGTDGDGTVRGRGVAPRRGRLGRGLDPSPELFLLFDLTRSPAVARMADRTAPLQTIYAKAVVHSCKSVQPFSRNVADKQISIAASCGLPELVPFGNLQGQPYLLLQTVFT